MSIMDVCFKPVGENKMKDRSISQLVSRLCGSREIRPVFSPKALWLSEQERAWRHLYAILHKFNSNAKMPQTKTAELYIQCCKLMWQQHCSVLSLNYVQRPYAVQYNAQYATLQYFIPKQCESLKSFMHECSSALMENVTILMSLELLLSLWKHKPWINSEN